MFTPITAIDVPLRQDPDGTIRVGNTRVTLDIVIEEYLSGSSPDQIADDYDVLDAADVHLVIGYYLAHRVEIDAYLKKRDEETEEILNKWEARYPSKPLSLATMKARLAERNQGD